MIAKTPCSLTFSVGLKTRYPILVSRLSTQTSNDIDISMYLSEISVHTFRRTKN